VLAPLVRRNGKLEETTWEDALETVAARFRVMDGASLAALASPRATNEALNLFAQLFNGLNVKSVSNLVPVPESMADEEGSLAMLDEADLFLVVGEDLDTDHQVAGIAVRRGVMNRGARLVVVGEGENGLTGLAHYQFRPDEIEQAVALAQNAETLVVVYGAAAGDLLSRLRAALCGKAQFLGLVPGSNGRGALAAGLSGSFEPEGVKVVFILSADDEVGETLLNKLEGAEFIVVQASYFGPLVECADVVLPTTIWAEKSGTFISTEGRAQTLNAALRPPAGVKGDLEILQALAERLGV
jgi:predicted molibdopterin-dependent oxidoreductase YjgC